MHNTHRFAGAERRQRALVHPKDAAAVGVGDGEPVRIVSVRGAVEIPVELTEDVPAGTIAVPHGWGHRDAGWRVANEAGGANVNVLTSALSADLEGVSGMAHLNGVPVRLEPSEHASR
jgi:formate dehydrogenase